MHRTALAWITLVASAFFGPSLSAADQAQSTARAAPDFATTIYSGTRGHHPIITKLTKQDRDLRGAYYDARYAVPLSLHGTCDATGGFVLREDASTGQWLGVLRGDARTLSGTWTSTDESRSRPFALTRIAMEARAEATFHISGATAHAERTFPVFLGDDEFFSAVNTRLQDELRTMEAEFARGFLSLAPFGAALDGLVSAGATRQLMDVHEYNVASYSDRFVSIVFTTYVYSGGAHGMTYFHSFNLRRTSGEDGAKTVALPAFFQAGTSVEAVLLALLIPKLKAWDAAWVVNGEATSFDLNGLSAYTASAHGLTFYFQPYAVGPYVQGTFQVDVSYEELGGAVDRVFIASLFGSPLSDQLREERAE